MHLERLTRAGCIAAPEELEELVLASDGDATLLDQFVERRCTGEPLAWITGSTVFCGMRVRVSPGVYVPRPHSELLAERSLELLPADGRALDLCTGCGAIAAVLQARRPGAQVLATDLDPGAVACASANGVHAIKGDLFDGIDPAWHGSVDVVVGVLPYVPRDELEFLARDVLDHEPVLALDGGDAGLEVVRRAISDAPTWLRAGGALVLEIGGQQAGHLEHDLAASGLELAELLRDEDGDVRALVAVSRA
jgi:release factor glutamine methyltransferase